MKKHFYEVLAWEYNGHTAIGISHEGNWSYTSLALNYFMDDNFNEGDIWWMDNIYTDEGCEVRFATDEEIQQLLNALVKWEKPYKYDKKTQTIRLYSIYPTTWMKVKKWFKEKFNTIWK